MLAAAVCSLFMAGAAAAEPQGAAPAAEIYAAKCAACHGTDRLGGTGPALIPEALVRLKKQERVRVARGQLRWSGDLEAMRAD